MNERIADMVLEFLRLIGENPSRDGLKDTPRRVSEAYSELLSGYPPNKPPEVTCFDNGCDGITYDQLIKNSGHFFSLCEHHIIPFFGTYHFAYLPDKKVMGLSKIARTVSYFSSRLQIQERLTKEIVDHLENATKPLGIGIVLNARHFCCEMRGPRQVGGEAETSDIRGLLRTDSSLKEEFLSFAGRHK